jgi:hypothetical protein
MECAPDVDTAFDRTRDDFKDVATVWACSNVVGDPTLLCVPGRRPALQGSCTQINPKVVNGQVLAQPAPR